MENRILQCFFADSTGIPPASASFPHAFQQSVENPCAEKVPAVSAAFDSCKSGLVESVVESCGMCFPQLVEVVFRVRQVFHDFVFHSTNFPLFPCGKSFPLFRKLSTGGLWESSARNSKENLRFPLFRSLYYYYYIFFSLYSVFSQLRCKKQRIACTVHCGRTAETVRDTAAKARNTAELRDVSCPQSSCKRTIGKTSDNTDTKRIQRCPGHTFRTPFKIDRSIGSE